MRTLLRTLMTPTSARTGLRTKARLDDDQKTAARLAIAAWSEVMGRESAELWVAATRAELTATPARHD